MKAQRRKIEGRPLLRFCLNPARIPEAGRAAVILPLLSFASRNPCIGDDVIRAI